MLLYALLLLCMSQTLAVNPERGVFVTCFSQTQCPLYEWTEAKRFLVDSIMKGEYGKAVIVEFVPKAETEFILYGPNNTEISREKVNITLTSEQLNNWLQSKGLYKVVLPPIDPGADTVVPAAAHREVQAALAAAAAPIIPKPKPKPKAAAMRPRARALVPRRAVPKRMHVRQAAASVAPSGAAAAAVQAPGVPGGESSSSRSQALATGLTATAVMMVARYEPLNQLSNGAGVPIAQLGVGDTAAGSHNPSTWSSNGKGW